MPMRLDLPDDIWLKEKSLRYRTVRISTQAALRRERILESAGYPQHQGEAMRWIELLAHACGCFSTRRYREGGQFCSRAFTFVRHMFAESAFLAAGCLDGRYSEEATYLGT
ncbi:hypothetical protein F4778DRAFT_753535 [Xylariomycetidae sp. FL2044]|nr:hypothetical protein F4778DRAFT_753535 [Xylariomycetidae sp. FL2044]